MYDYSVRLADRNEGIEYRDPDGTYRFDVSKNGRQWTVFLPATKGVDHEHELTPEEEARILPRISQYLSRIRWFGLFPFSYQVAVERQPPFSIEDHYRQLEQEGYRRQVLSDGRVPFIPPKVGVLARIKGAIAILRALVGR